MSGRATLRRRAWRAGPPLRNHKHSKGWARWHSTQRVEWGEKVSWSRERWDAPFSYKSAQILEGTLGGATWSIRVNGLLELPLLGCCILPARGPGRLADRRPYLSLE